MRFCRRRRQKYSYFPITIRRVAVKSPLVSVYCSTPEGSSSLRKRTWLYPAPYSPRITRNHTALHIAESERRFTALWQYKTNHGLARKGGRDVLQQVEAFWCQLRIAKVQHHQFHLQEIQKNSNKNLVIFFMMITRYLQKKQPGKCCVQNDIGLYAPSATARINF